MIDKYDVARWRPIVPAAFVQSLCQMSFTSDEPKKLTIDIEDLQTGQIRLVVHGPVQQKEGPPGYEPYLMIIHEMTDAENTTKILCFGRTDVDLSL